MLDSSIVIIICFGSLPHLYILGRVIDDIYDYLCQFIIILIKYAIFTIGDMEYLTSSN